MKCRNCLSSFENRKSTRKKIISCSTAQCLQCFTHIKFEHDIVESCVGLCAGRSESRIVTERNVRTPSQSLSSLVLRRLYTLAWPSRDTSDTSLSFIFWAVYLFVHRSTNIRSQEVLKVKLALLLDRIRLQDPLSRSGQCCWQHVETRS